MEERGPEFAEERACEEEKKITTLQGMKETRVLAACICVYKSEGKGL